MDVSVVDLTVRLQKEASYDEIMAACKKAADGELKVCSYHPPPSHLRVAPILQSGHIPGHKLTRPGGTLFLLCITHSKTAVCFAQPAADSLFHHPSMRLAAHFCLSAALSRSLLPSCSLCEVCQSTRSDP